MHVLSAIHPAGMVCVCCLVHFQQKTVQAIYSSYKSECQIKVR